MGSCCWNPGFLGVLNLRGAQEMCEWEGGGGWRARRRMIQGEIGRFTCTKNSSLAIREIII